LLCAAPNLVALRTKDGVASLSDLPKERERANDQSTPPPGIDVAAHKLTRG
jgi:hypothetical protein